MTFREKLADWISGGALSDALHYEEVVNAAYEKAVSRALFARDDADASRAALRQIAALETPHANATVRKMARIAREAVK